MANFEATVRLLDLDELDAAAARRTVEERLRTVGFSRWQIISLGIQGAATPRARRSARPPMPTRTEVSYAGGGLLVAAVAAWALWFLWLLAG